MTDMINGRIGDVGTDIGEREFVPTQWPFFWLTQATGKYISHLEPALKKVGLDIPRWRVLMCLDRNRQRSISEIAELAIVKLPTMMKIVQRMQADDLVRCESRVGDGRVTDVSLTEQGIEARTIAWRAAQRIFDKVFADVPADEQKQLNHLLRNIINRLDG